MITNTPGHDASPMHLALALAHQAIALCEPNPRVGCVITAPDGRVIGRGYTQQAGGPHAEVMALRDAQAHGEPTRGATAYVSLEPCAHHGRTPPCCDALIEAGIACVHLAVQDPNPLVTGQGSARLRAAGVVVYEGELAAQAQALNVGFFSRMQRGRPWVRLKAALTLDGKTSLPNGTSQWITGEQARADGQAYRQRASAVLTGVGTVLADNPRLNVRLPGTTQQPLRVVIDSELRTSCEAQILQPPGGVRFYAAAPDARRSTALQARGAVVVPCPGLNGKVNLQDVLVDLAQLQVNELHIEAGPRLNGAWLSMGCVDELLLYMAPTIMGSGQGLAALGPLQQLQDQPAFEFHSITPLGDDIRILARPRAAF